MTYDAIIVGGSYAGLSAALQLARARRRIAVIDSGQRRNRFASSSHGFLGQDGRDPVAIVEDAREQLLRYPSVSWRPATATGATGAPEAFRVELDDGVSVEGRRLVLATGVRDALPAVPGLAERWGQSVFHCPYCHGYELDQGEIGVLATSALSLHQALMLPDWGPTTLFLNGAFEPDHDQLAQLRRRGVRLEHEAVERIEGDEKAIVVLRGGRSVHCEGVFVASATDMASPLADQLGCAFDQGPLGRFMRTDGMKETSVPGVFACGDAARGAGSVALAVGDGTQAGVSAHRSLMFG